MRLYTTWQIGGQEEIEMYSLEVLSNCQYALGHKYEVESIFQEAIERNEVVYGNYDSYNISLKRHKEWLREWRREVESAILKVGIDQILGPDDIELEDMNFEELWTFWPFTVSYLSYLKSGYTWWLMGGCYWKLCRFAGRGSSSS